MHQKGCLYCHDVAGQGGHRGPELTAIGDLLTRDQMIIRISNGGHNMPSFAGNVTTQEMNEIVAFLESRKRARPAPATTKEGSGLRHLESVPAPDAPAPVRGPFEFARTPVP